MTTTGPRAGEARVARTTPTTAGGSAARDRYRWVAMAVVLIGTFMVILDTSIVNIALPKIGSDFGSISGVEWIVTGYLLSVGVSQMATGWVADRVGRKTAFVGSLAIFTLSSLLCALAPNLSSLVGFRVLQGLGGGALMPVAMAMIYELFPPEERGQALGIWGIAAMAAPSIGPVLGGALVTGVGWRWLFLVNVPIGVAGVLLALRLLRDVGFREHRPFDHQGLWLSGTGLVLLLIGLAQSGEWTWGSPKTLTCLVGGTLLLVWFVRRSLRVEHPLVDVRMYGIGVFSLSLAVIWLLTVAQFARLVFIPLQLETLRGLSALKVGVALTPSALGVAVTMPIGGRMADKVGVRLPVVVGLAILAASFWPLAHLSASTSLWTIAGILFFGGLGAGLAMMPNTVAGMNSVPSRLVSQASAVRSLNRQLAGAFGTAVLASVLASRGGSIVAHTAAGAAHANAAYNDVFLIGFYLLIVAFALAFALPGREQTLALQEARRRDSVVDPDGSPIASAPAVDAH